MFVARKSSYRNELRLVPGSTHPAIQVESVRCDRWDWLWPDAPEQAALTAEGLPVTVRLGRNMVEAPSILNYNANTKQAILTFKEPQQAAALGQFAVAWLDDWCLGCGPVSANNTLA